mgnify:CR=1 FL=1
MREKEKAGINIDIGGNVTNPKMKFNDFDKVKVGKYQRRDDGAVNIDMYPGRTRKPTVTMVNQKNYGWGKFSDSEEEEQPLVKTITKTIIKEVPIFIEAPPADPIVRTKYIKTPPPKPIVVTEQKPQAAPVIIQKTEKLPPPPPVGIREPVPVIVEKEIPAPQMDIDIEIE